MSHLMMVVVDMGAFSFSSFSSNHVLTSSLLLPGSLLDTGVLSCISFSLLFFFSSTSSFSSSQVLTSSLLLPSLLLVDTGVLSCISFSLLSFLPCPLLPPEL